MSELCWCNGGVSGKKIIFNKFDMATMKLLINNLLQNPQSLSLLFCFFQ